VAQAAGGHPAAMIINSLRVNTLDESAAILR
jgi:hypothetical protein